MPLDPEVKAYLDQQAASGMTPRHLLPVEQARQQTIQTARLAGPPGAVHAVRDQVIDGPGGPLTLRIYTPDGEGPFPGLVYFHGGGWVLCNLDTHDSLVRTLAHNAGCVIASVDYRLAPENKYPAALEDCYAATEWFKANAADLHVDPDRIGVGGDSCGGNVAAVVCLMARSKQLPLICQLLMYPITGYYDSD